MSERPVRDRHVVLVAAAIVAVVLGLLTLSAVVPAFGEAISVAPLLIVALVVVTGVVLFRALRPPRR